MSEETKGAVSAESAVTGESGMNAVDSGNDTPPDGSEKQDSGKADNGAQEDAAGSKEPERFDKAALMRSARFKDSRDIVQAVLEDGKEYSMKETEKLIHKFLKGKVT